MSNGYYRPGGFGGFNVFPPVIKNLLLINAAVFFVSILMRNITVEGVLLEGYLNKYFALNSLRSGFMPWQLITYQFMHANFSHILFNMFALWMFGQEIENLWGSKKFLIFYLLSGIGAGLLHLVVSSLMGQGYGVTVGASGAIYGVMVAYAMTFPDRYIFLWFVIPVKAKYLIGFLIALEFLMVDSTGSTVAHLAHLGGAIVGFLFILLDKDIHVDLKDSLGIGKRNKNPFTTYQEDTTWKKPSTSGPTIRDAEFYDINSNKVADDDISQEEIDRILDKISQSGYANLTERDKQILFKASKKTN